MLSGCETKSGTCHGGKPARARTKRGSDRTAAVARRTLATGEILFQDGDTRARLYRVVSGALCHYINWDDGRHEVIEFAFPGDVIGLGYLDSHISTAQAIAETDVSILDAHDFADALETDGQLSARLAAAADREFEVLRERAIASTRSKPLARVASFLVAMSRMNSPEGRDPALVTDEMTSGPVAELLHMSIASLADALRDLEQRGLVTPAENGVRLNDVDALEKLADAA